MKKIAHRFFICFITGLIGGILIGCTMMSALVSYRIDQYHEEIMYLKTVIEDSDIKYKKLKESFDNVNKKKFLVSDIEVHLMYVDGEENNFDKMELIKYIKDKYKDLLWKEVRGIDTDLVVGLIDDDILMIEDKSYELGVSRVLISDVFKIWVTVKRNQ
ncbi:MAG: hypothetical protein GX383_07615 [Clostridium sp.]|nr:hypothetical protein [Clostridium sp.]